MYFDDGFCTPTCIGRVYIEDENSLKLRYKKYGLLYSKGAPGVAPRSIVDAIYDENMANLKIKKKIKLPKGIDYSLEDSFKMVLYDNNLLLYNISKRELYTIDKARFKILKKEIVEDALDTLDLINYYKNDCKNILINKENLSYMTKSDLESSNYRQLINKIGEKNRDRESIYTTYKNYNMYSYNYNIKEYDSNNTLTSENSLLMNLNYDEIIKNSSKLITTLHYTWQRNLVTYITIWNIDKDEMIARVNPVYLKLQCYDYIIENNYIWFIGKKFRDNQLYIYKTKIISYNK